MKYHFILLLFLSHYLKCVVVNYTNPIIYEEAPEPSIIKADDNYFYIFTTFEKIYRSRDFSNWDYIGKAFDGRIRPTFVDGVSCYWAPCITKQDNLYILYFALSNDAQTQTGIGVAISSNPEGPYDIMNSNGKLFLDAEVGVSHSIHPSYFEEEGKKYIIFGFRNGIFGIELNSDGVSVKDMNEKFQLAGTKFDLPNIYKRNKYYYLIASIGNANTLDVNSNSQKVVIGRSTSFKGPYTSKNGGLMLTNSYDILITNNAYIGGPGSNSIIKDKYTGKTWIFYHAIVINDNKDTRYPCMDELKWDEDDWPYIETNSPSYASQEGVDIFYLINKNITSNSNKSEYVQDLIEYLLENYNIFNVTNGKDFEIEIGDNILVALTTTDNQKDEEHINKTTIYLGDCEKRLKFINNIPLNDSLYMIKMNIKEEGMKIPKIEYLICYPLYKNKLIPLNLTECQNNIDVSIPVKISEDINKHNISSNYYNDLCSKATSNSNTDITLSDRKKEFIEENKTLCEEDCNLVDYNYTIEKAKCSCKIKYNFPSSIDNIKFDKDKFLQSFIDISNIINIKIVKCYRYVFIGKSLLKNYGFFIFTIILFFYFITLLLFLFKFYFSLKKEIMKIMTAKIKLYEYEKKKSIDLNIKNKNNKRVKNCEYSKKLIYNKKKSKMNPPQKGKKRKNKKNLYINNNILIMPVDKRNKSFCSSSNIIPFSTNKKDKKYIKILEFTNYELNVLAYEDALIYDKRTFSEYYKSLLIGGHLILFSFYINDREYNSWIIKMFLFFFFFSIHITVNALFFNDDTIHEIYIDKGSYNFLYQLSQIIYSTIISAVINIFIKFLSLSERNISKFKLDKENKNIKTKFNKLIRVLIIKFIFFFSISFFILLLCMFYISCFCGIYVNTQIHLIKDSITSFGISFIYPFALYLIPGILRISSLTSKIKNKNCIYNISKFLKLLI